jgi:pyrroline-5-carboxylate reductase
MPSTNGTLGIIGCGNMGEAILRGLKNAGLLNPGNVVVSAKHQRRVDELVERYGVRGTLDNRELAGQAEVLVLAVKPQIVHGVLEEIAPAVRDGTMVVSVIAGLTIAAIQKGLGKTLPVVRTMPNTPALILEGATAIAFNGSVSEVQLERVRRMFTALGKVVVVDEAQMNAVTGLSGSGPAYVFLTIDALADAGVRVGLSRQEALLLAAQTVLGSARLLLETGEHPGRLKDMVTSPGGTAIAGVATLEAGGLRTTLIRAVEAATQRCAELGKQAE